MLKKTILISAITLMPVLAFAVRPACPSLQDGFKISRAVALEIIASATVTGNAKKIKKGGSYFYVCRSFNNYPNLPSNVRVTIFSKTFHSAGSTSQAVKEYSVKQKVEMLKTHQGGE